MTLTHVNPSNRLAVAVASVLALAAPDGRAAASEPSATPLEEVTVYARRLQPVTRIAATVTVIDAGDIDRTLAGDVKQMVRYEPGLSVSRDPFRYGLDTFTIRGVGGNRVAVDVDGIPSAPGFTIGNYSNSGRAFVDLAFVQRVEVLRGPASSLYGSDAIGGVVAMTTFRPSALLADDDKAAIRAQGGYDSSDDGWRAAVLGAVRVGPADVLAGYVHRQGHQPETAADVRPDQIDYDADSLLLTGQIETMPGGPLTLTAEGGRLHQTSNVDAWELLSGSRFANTTLLRGDDSGERFRVSAAQQLGSTPAFDSATWDLYWQATDADQRTLEQRRAIAKPKTPPTQYDRRFMFDGHVIGAEFGAVKDLEAGRWTHDIVYGVELSALRMEELRDATVTNLDTGETSSTIPSIGESYPLRDFPVTDVVQVGLYAQDEIRLADGTWSVIPALRVDYYDLTPDPDPVWESSNPQATAVGLTDTSVSPKFGVTRQLSGSASTYFQYSHGYRAPPPEDVNISVYLPQLNVQAIPNPDLKAEVSNGYEVGVRYDSGALRFSLAGYYNDYDDFIESKIPVDYDPATKVTTFQSRNIAKARIYGTELSGTLRAGEVADALRGWTARVSAAWSKGDDLNEDQPINSVDPGEALLSLAYDAPSGRWRGELVTTAVAAKREVAPVKVGTRYVDPYRTGAYVTLDLLAQMDLGHGFEVDLGLFNLTDQAYIEWADVRGRPAGDPLIPYYTNPGRNASITLRWNH